MTFNFDKNFRRIAFSALIFGFAVGATAAPAMADSTDAPSMTVKFSDLDVSKPAGAAQLYARIRAAAGQLCVPRDNESLGNGRIWDLCFKDAVAEAVKQVNRPALTAVHQGKTGQLVSTLVASNDR